MTHTFSLPGRTLAGSAKAEAWQSVCHWMQSRKKITLPKSSFVTGLKSVDHPCGGGIPGGTLCEFIALHDSCGAQTLLHHLLVAAREQQLYAALVDLGPNFDPGSAPEHALECLLWVQCKTVKEALQAADTIARDDNITLLLVDLCAAGCSPSHGVAATAWYRLQRALAEASTVTAVFARQQVSTASRLRWEINGHWQIDDLDASLSAGILDRRIIASTPAVTAEWSSAG